ncbi:MAG: SDR family oxidoreductase [Candidatus Neomarinimicrobiota bacterium]
MNILLAGGAGYIGSALAPELVERKYNVTVVDLFWFGDHLPENIARIKKNVLDLKEADLHGYDQVIFLSGLSNDPMAEFSPSANFIYNASAPAYLGYISKRAGVKRFIYASSCSVYGYTVDELYDEKSPTISNYPYGISKLLGEQAVIQMQDTDFSVISLRQGTVCGFSPRMRLDLVVNTMFKTAMLDRTISVNNPVIWRPILSIKDAIAAYVRAVEAPDGISGIFNVASGNYTVGEIADQVKAVIEEALDFKLNLNMMHKEDYRNYKVSIENARNILSFKPRHDIDSIVRNLLDNYNYFKDLNNKNYYNIEVFKTIRL